MFDVVQLQGLGVDSTNSFLVLIYSCPGRRMQGRGFYPNWERFTHYSLCNDTCVLGCE